MGLPSLRLERARCGHDSAAAVVAVVVVVVVVVGIAGVADAGPVEAGRPEGAGLVVPSTQIGWRWIAQGARRRI